MEGRTILPLSEQQMSYFYIPHACVAGCKALSAEPDTRGFVVKAERKRKTPDPKTWTENLVGKPLPDMERLKEKIRKIADEAGCKALSAEPDTRCSALETSSSIPPMLYY